MKTAVVIYNSKTGTTKKYAEDIANYLKSKEISVSLSSIQKYQESLLENAARMQVIRHHAVLHAVPVARQVGPAIVRAIVTRVFQTQRMPDFVQQDVKIPTAGNNGTGRQGR